MGSVQQRMYASDMDVDLVTLAAIAFGLLIVAACIAWGFRYARRSRDHLEQAAQAHNAAMKALADLLGQDIRVVGEGEHAAAGGLRPWNSIVGSIDGIHLAVGADFDGGGEGPSTIETRVRVRRGEVRPESPPPRGKASYRLPKHRQRLEADVPSLPRDVVADLADLAERVVAAPKEITVTARATPRQRSTLAYVPRLLLDPGALARLVRATLILTAHWNSRRG